jgi:hypothetical protein
MNNENIDQTSTSDEKVVELVAKAKHRPLPRSTKALFAVVIFAMVFTGGAAYGKHKATASTGTGLSLAALENAGGFGAAGFGNGGFGNGRTRRNGGTGTGTASATGTDPLTLTPDGTTGAPGAGAASTTAVASDVAGTVVSITAKSVVIATLSGGNETFPITDTTKVRSSSKIDLSTVKAGDIVTIKPDESANAKTIMVVK